MDALLEHQRKARPAADRGVETRKPAGAGSRRSCPRRAASQLPLDRTRLRLGLRGVSSTPLVMLENVYYGLSTESITPHARSFTFPSHREDPRTREDKPHTDS